MDYGYFWKVKETYSRYDMAKKKADEKGLVVVVPKDDELFIDIDDQASMDAFDKVFPKLMEPEGVFSYQINPSPSGRPGRFHIVIKLLRPVKDVYERIFLQVLLGSDRMREALSYQRALKGDEVPTLFFEKKPL